MLKGLLAVCTSPPRQGRPLTKGPSTQIVRFQGPNTTSIIVLGPSSPIIWVLGPLGNTLGVKTLRNNAAE